MVQIKEIHLAPVPVVLLALLVATVPGVFAGEPSASNPIQITGSARGQSLAVEAATRFSNKGVRTIPADLEVIDFGQDGVLIAPKGFTVLGPGSIETQGLPKTASLRPAPRQEKQTLAATWSPVGGACFARHYEDLGFMDTCYHTHKLSSDGSSTYDWFELHLFASMFGNNPGSEIDLGWVRAEKSGSVAQTWWDWSPKSAITGSCRQITLSVTYIVGISYSHDFCQSWTMSKGNPTVWMKEQYNGNSLNDQEVALVLAVRVANGQSPTWNLNWDMTVRCYANFDCDDL